MILSKPLLRRRQEKCFWNNRDICTNFWNCKLFPPCFRLILVGFSLRILRIETQLSMHETFYAWIKPKSVKKFKRCTSWKIWSPCFLFWKISTRNFFYSTFYTEPNWTCFEDCFNNVIRTVKSYDCCFIRGRYLSEYELIERHEAHLDPCFLLQASQRFTKNICVQLCYFCWWYCFVYFK